MKNGEERWRGREGSTLGCRSGCAGAALTSAPTKLSTAQHSDMRNHIICTTQRASPNVILQKAPAYFQQSDPHTLNRTHTKHHLTLVCMLQHRRLLGCRQPHCERRHHIPPLHHSHRHHATPPLPPQLQLFQPLAARRLPPPLLRLTRLQAAGQGRRL